MVDVKLHAGPRPLIEVVFLGVIETDEITADRRFGDFIKTLKNKKFRVLCDFSETSVMRDAVADVFFKAQDFAVKRGMERDAFVCKSKVLELQLARLARSNRRAEILGNLHFFDSRDAGLAYLLKLEP